MTYWWRYDGTFDHLEAVRPCRLDTAAGRGRGMVGARRPPRELGGIRRGPFSVGQRLAEGLCRLSSRQESW